MKPITQEQKAILNKCGYHVEDMGAEHGPEWVGQYRWLNDATGDFQDLEPSYSEEEAWQSCWAFYSYINNMLVVSAMKHGG